MRLSRRLRVVATDDAVTAPVESADFTPSVPAVPDVWHPPVPVVEGSAAVAPVPVVPEMVVAPVPAPRHALRLEEPAPSVDPGRPAPSPVGAHAAEPRAAEEEFALASLDLLTETFPDTDGGTSIEGHGLLISDEDLANLDGIEGPINDGDLVFAPYREDGPLMETPPDEAADLVAAEDEAWPVKVREIVVGPGEQVNRFGARIAPTPPQPTPVAKSAFGQMIREVKAKDAALKERREIVPSVQVRLTNKEWSLLAEHACCGNPECQQRTGLDRGAQCEDCMFALDRLERSVNEIVVNWLTAQSEEVTVSGGGKRRA